VQTALAACVFSAGIQHVQSTVITHTSGSRGVSRVIICICGFVCMSDQKEKWLELSSFENSH